MVKLSNGEEKRRKGSTPLRPGFPPLSDNGDLIQAKIVRAIYHKARRIGEKGRREGERGRRDRGKRREEGKTGRRG